jgi:hypothetical protein
VRIVRLVATALGVPSIRLVSDMTMLGNELRQVIYAVPGYRDTATLTYSAERSRFDEYVNAFDASAERTDGARVAPSLGFDFGEMAGAGVAGGLIGVCMALLRRFRSSRSA